MPIILILMSAANAGVAAQAVANSWMVGGNVGVAVALALAALTR